MIIVCVSELFDKSSEIKFNDQAFLPLFAVTTSLYNIFYHFLKTVGSVFLRLNDGTRKCFVAFSIRFFLVI